MTDHTADGAPFRILNVIDEYSRVCIESYVARSIGASRVRQVLERLFATRGRPELIRSDNGREFIAETLGNWLAEHRVASAFVEKGSPQQNAFVERFNGSMRRECLNVEEFDSILEARVVIGEWRVEYNTVRPHRGLRGMTPAAFEAAERERAPGSAGQTGGPRKKRGR